MLVVIFMDSLHLPRKQNKAEDKDHRAEKHGFMIGSQLHRVRCGADCVVGSVTSVTRGLLCLGFVLCRWSGCVARVSSFSDALALSRAPLILGRAAAHRVGDGDVGDDPASEIEPWGPRPRPPHHCQK